MQLVWLAPCTFQGSEHLKAATNQPAHSTGDGLSVGQDGCMAQSHWAACHMPSPEHAVSLGLHLGRPSDRPQMSRMLASLQ